LLGDVAPIPLGEDIGEGAAACSALTPAFSPGQTARILSDGDATAPAQAATAVVRAIAAGNLIHTLPYPEPDVHYGTLAQLWPAYDCSGATSFVLYAAGVLGPTALDPTELESFGLPGPGRWITVYADSTHAWIVVAGIALGTADYGGPAVPGGSGPRWRGKRLRTLATERLLCAASGGVVRRPAAGAA
jgi:hypothetical protein